MKGYVNPQLLVAPRALAAELEGSETSRPLVLDLRPAEAYTAGHIPGAIHINLWGLSLTDTDPAPLNAFMWMIEHVLAIHGVDRLDADRRLRRAVRSPRRAGVLVPRVLRSSVSARARRGIWRLDARSTAGDARRRSAAQERVDRRSRGAHPGTWRDVRDAIARPDAVILDARSDGEFCGTTVRAKRGGAIPGAVHIEWTRNLTAEGEFKPAAELRAMYEEAGVTPDREVIAYCQGGYRAAHAYLALRLLGYPRVRNYVGSWKEWGDREELPIRGSVNS